MAKKTMAEIYSENRLLQVKKYASIILLFFIVSCQEKIEIGGYDEIKIVITVAYEKPKLIKNGKSLNQYNKVNNGAEDFYLSKNKPNSLFISEKNVTGVFLEKDEYSWLLITNINNKAKEDLYEYTKHNEKKTVIIMVNNEILKVSPIIASPLKTNRLEFPLLCKEKEKAKTIVEKIFSNKNLSFKKHIF